MSLRNVVPLIVLLLCPTAPCARAGVLVVDKNGGGDFTTIQSAVNAAADGDVLLIEDGVYFSFIIAGKGLQIVADEGTDVHVFGSIVVQDLGAQQSVTFRGFTAATTPMFTGQVRFDHNAGPILVEDCTLRNATVHHGVQINDCAAVTFARCIIKGAPSPYLGLPNAGLVASESQVALYDCELTGGLGAFGAGGGTGLSGGPAARLAGGFFFASGTSFTGGTGGMGIKQCDASGCICADGGTGGFGIELYALDPVAVTQDCSFTGGGPGAVADPVNCSIGVPGVPMELASGELQTLAGPARHFQCQSPIVESSSLQLDFAGQPGDMAFVLLSFHQDFAFLSQGSGVLVAARPDSRLLGVVPASGELATTFDVRALPPGVDSLSMVLQAGVIDTNGARLVGPPSTLVILDELVGS